MSLFGNNSHLKFLKNKEFNKLYSSVFIMTFGESLINIFVPIYLFGLWYPVYQIIFFYFLVSLYFVILAHFGAKIVSKVGEKHSILISSPFLVLFYLGLMYVNISLVLFFILPLFLSLRMILFNFGYHLNYINHSEKRRRWKELAILWILTLIATVVAPYLGSLIASINFMFVFVLSSVLIVLGTFPLLFSQDRFEKISFTANWLFKKIFSKKNRGNFISFSGYAVESMIGRIVWPLFLILIVGTINKTWLLISASMFFSLFALHFVGKLTDKINKTKLLKIWTVLYVWAWIGRVFASTVYQVFFVDSYKNISEKVLYLPWSAQSYDLAQRDNYFEFIVSMEITFNFIRILVFPFLIFIFWIDFYPFVVSFVLASFASLGYVFIDK